MYLSKITLTPSHAFYSQGVAGAELSRYTNAMLTLNDNTEYGAHQVLWQLFSQEKERPYIFRQEPGLHGTPIFFVLSSCPPQMDNDIFQVQTKLFEPKLEVGQRLAFKLRVNPTICITDEQGKSKRHDVLMHAKQKIKAQALSAQDVKRHMDNAAHAWITDETRLASWGISLESLPDIEAYTQHQSKKASKGKFHKVSFSSVDFQGILTVVSPEKFLLQYEKGFGRAKALGCGLMLIRGV